MKERLIVSLVTFLGVVLRFARKTEKTVLRWQKRLADKLD